MEDKTFQLLEKLYVRMEEGFKEIRSEMATKNEMDAGFKRADQNMARMEQKFDDKISILFEAVKGNTEAINGLKAEMQKLETKVDEHEVKLKIVK